MRNRLLLALVALTVAGIGLGLSNTRTTEAQGGPLGFQLPPQAREVAPNVYFIGSRVVAGRVVDGYAHVATRPTAQTGKPLGAGGNKGGGTSTESSCYSITSGRRWETPEPFIVHPDADNVLTAAVVNNAANAWEHPTANVSLDIFDGSAIVSTAGLSDINTMDDLNEVSLRKITDPGVIAVTYTWAYRGPPSVRQILEWDMVIDSDAEWNWGDTVSEAFPKGGMQIGSIVTHEIGHAAGMGHTDTSALCQPETMYPYVDFGDESKAILKVGDETGIVALYK